MMKNELFHTFAEEEGKRAEDAADDLDRAVARVLRTLRNGKSAKLPGIGTIQPGRNWVLRPDRNDR